MTWLDSIQQQGRELGNRALDRHIRLGVTGLSGSGKTAFITSLVHQLTQGDQPSHLPFLEVIREKRYLGGRVAVEQALALPRFPYEQNLQSLLQQPPVWPPSTSGWSQLTMQLRYKARNGLRAKLQSHSELTLDIIDYPGEWLLDLPMLQQNYRQWCEFCWQLFSKPHRASQAQLFREQLLTADLQDVSELGVQKLTDNYKVLLQAYNQTPGTYLNQPGRLLVPGELAGTPMLQLFPLLPEQLAENSPLAERLEKHYQGYCRYVIQPFYKHYFARLDRQVVLVDCLSALNAGYTAVQELLQALQLILQSFQYGPSSLLGRLFSPSITKVLFAASKADHVTPEQHKPLTLLLQQLLQQPLKQSQYQAAETEAMALAAIRASEAGFVSQAGQKLPCISGVSADGQQPVTLFPGDVPAEIPDPGLFSRHQFSFPVLQPLALSPHQPIPHLRMDHALQFLLGDKLR